MAHHLRCIMTIHSMSSADSSWFHLILYSTNLEVLLNALLNAL